ncbi:MAG: hypothetical protein ACI9GW_001902 [Halieaceae bacterium]|jgi:hypothetical protein
MKFASAIIMTCLLCFSAQAQIYKHIDANGNVTFTDKPPENAVLIDLGHTNTVPAPDKPSQAAPKRMATIEEIAPPERYSINIISPLIDAAIPNGPGNFSVDLSVTPDLHPRDSLQLFVDGDPLGRPQRGTSWGLTNISRGTHSLEARIIDNRGDVKGRSPSVRVHVFRPISN